MRQCDIEVDLLKDEVEQNVWTFRWVWLFNLAALILGLVTGNYVLTAVAGVTAMTALVGIGRTRHGKKLLDGIVSRCLRPGRADSDQSS